MAAASRLLLAVVPLLTLATEYPVPPRRTPTQIRVIEEREVQARAASDAARPQVLEFFASKLFRDAVRECCPGAARMSPEALLQRFREEVWASEYAHVFPLLKDGSPTGSSSATIPLAEEYKFLLNGYQAKLAGNGTDLLEQGRFGGAPPSPPNVGLMAEENIFGLPPFANESQPTWDEAADRLVYVAQNMRRLNNGNVPIFGQATIIFDNDYIKDMVLTAPVDTGMWEFICNHTMPIPIDLNCDAYKPMETVVGTWGHFDHVILQNLGAWRTSEFKSRTTLAEEVKGLFDRSGFNDDYLAVSNLTRLGAQKYWESNVVGNVRLPEGVRFLIGNFGQLFGTKGGRELQSFARKFGWPLVWAFTEFMEVMPPNMTDDRTYHMTGRLVDPTVPGSQALNATFSPDMGSHFETMWAAVALAHKTNTTSPGKFTNWWHALYASQVPVAPSTARLCGSSQTCIGYDVRSDSCVCRNSATIII